MGQIREPIGGEALGQALLAEILVTRVVDQEHLAAGSDDAGQDLGVVTPAREDVRHGVAALEAGQGQHLGRLVAGIALAVRGAARGVGQDAFDACGFVDADAGTTGQEGNGNTGREQQGAHGGTPWTIRR
jgi:hypothetical protein